MLRHRHLHLPQVAACSTKSCEGLSHAASRDSRRVVTEEPGEIECVTSMGQGRVEVGRLRSWMGEAGKETHRARWTGILIKVPMVGARGSAPGLEVEGFEVGLPRYPTRAVHSAGSAAPMLRCCRQPWTEGCEMLKHGYCYCKTGFIAVHLLWRWPPAPC